MRRKIRYFAAAAAEILRFTVSGLLAAEFFTASPGTIGAALNRSIAVPQLLIPAGFFLLWYDQGRYRAYRPLLIAGKVAISFQSIILVLSMVLAYLREGSSFPPSVQAFVSGIALVALDLLALLCLVLPDRRDLQPASSAPHPTISEETP